MLTEVLNRVYLGNTVTAWLATTSVIFLTVTAGKVLHSFSKCLVRRSARGTETRFHTLAVDVVRKPVVFSLAVTGIGYGLHILELSESVELWIGNASHALIVLSVAWLASRLVETLFREYLLPLTEGSDNDFDDYLVPVLQQGSQVIIWTFGIILALNNAGYDVGAVLAGLGIGGLALAMAAKETVSNVFGSLTVFVDRPFKRKDWIQVAQYKGSVEEIGIRSTRLRTTKGTLVTIPNARFTDTAVENISLEPARKVEARLRLSYHTGPSAMEEALAQVAAAASAHQDADDVTAVLNEFGDWGMEILLVYYIKKDSDILRTRGEINMSILRALEAAGIRFSFRPGLSADGTGQFSVIDKKLPQSSVDETEQELSRIRKIA